MIHSARTIAQLLEAGDDKATAITAPGGVPLTYGALRAQVHGIVSALNERGIGANDRVAIVLDNGPEMATAIPAPNTWSAYPFPSSILLYKDGQGYPTFDLAKAKTYFAKVNDKITALIDETIKKWDLAEL